MIFLRKEVEISYRFLDFSLYSFNASSINNYIHRHEFNIYLEILSFVNETLFLQTKCSFLITWTFIDSINLKMSSLFCNIYLVSGISFKPFYVDNKCMILVKLFIICIYACPPMHIYLIQSVFLSFSEEGDYKKKWIITIMKHSWHQS